MNERTRNALIAKAAEDQADAVLEIHKVARELSEKMDKLLEAIQANQAAPTGPKPGKAKTEKATES